MSVTSKSAEFEAFSVARHSRNWFKGAHLAVTLRHYVGRPPRSPCDSSDPLKAPFTTDRVIIGRHFLALRGKGTGSPARDALPEQRISRRSIRVAHALLVDDFVYSLLPKCSSFRLRCRSASCERQKG